MALAAPLWAGEVKSSKAPIPPPEEPNLWNWFVGGSVGYLVDFEEPFYSVHVGVDTPYKVAGWDTALYLEVGYTDTDDSVAIVDPNVIRAVATTPLNADLEIIPLTFNMKFERQLTGSLNAYFGAGLGVAFTDFGARANFVPGPTPDVNISSKDTVFAAQVFAGLIYNFNEHFEVFGGARWIYIDDSSVAGLPGVLDVDFGSDVLFELGGRYTF